MGNEIKLSALAQTADHVGTSIIIIIIIIITSIIWFLWPPEVSVFVALFLIIGR